MWWKDQKKNRLVANDEDEFAGMTIRAKINRMNLQKHFQFALSANENDNLQVQQAQTLTAFELKEKTQRRFDHRDAVEEKADELRLIKTSEDDDRKNEK